MEMTFGEKIRMLMEKEDMNQTQLGKAVHMTKRRISYIECDKYEPSMDDIRLFCEFFGVSVDYLLGIPAKKNKNNP